MAFSPIQTIQNIVMSKKDVLEILRGVLIEQKEFVPLHVPKFAGDEWRYVKECIDTGWVSTAGKFVDQFEKSIAAFCEVDYAVAVCNGTSALHICLLVSGVQQGDEVIIPTLTFVATANAVKYAGGIPHFADAEETTLGIDPIKLQKHLERVTEIRDGICYNRETGRRIAALMPMHTFGHPVQICELRTIATQFRLTLIEDAAESLGSYYKGQHCGGFSEISALSFNGNKIITTGGGGALLTNNQSLAKQAKHITTTAKLPHAYRYDHDVIGYNYRMPNLNAALGVAQLKQLPEFLKQKRDLAQRYANAFETLTGIRFVTEPSSCKSNYWLNALLLERGKEDQLEPILKITNDAGFMTRPAWTPMHQLTLYADAPRMNLSVADSLAQRLINIPSSVGL